MLTVNNGSNNSISDNDTTGHSGGKESSHLVEESVIN